MRARAQTTHAEHHIDEVTMLPDDFMSLSGALSAAQRRTFATHPHTC